MSAPHTTKQCDGSCQTRDWSQDRRREWSDHHAPRREARVLAPPVPFMAAARRGRIAAQDRALAGSAAAREHQQQVLSRWKGSQPRAAVGPDALRGLRDRTTLHLGDSGTQGALLAVLPRGQQPLTPPNRMLAELLPEVAGDAGYSWRLVGAESRLSMVGDRRPGLFWDGPMAYHAGAWSHALLRNTEDTRSKARLVVGPMPKRYEDCLLYTSDAADE